LKKVSLDPSKTSKKGKMIEMNYREDYMKLADYLQNRGEDELTLTFDSIENIMEKPLPVSAYKHNAWWGSDPKHSQCVWLKIGYKACYVNLTQKTVTFCKF